jgi:acyl carrier protein
VSNVSGAWITDAQATDPAYWAQHMRRTVRFADGAGELLRNPKLSLLEVGPGQALSSLTRQPGRARLSERAATVATGAGGLGEARPAGERLILSSFPGAQSPQTETDAILSALGQLWLHGAVIDLSNFYAHEERRRVRLPTYPFERKRFFIEPAPVAVMPRRSADGSSARIERIEVASNGAPSVPAVDVETRGRAGRAPISPRDQLATELRVLFGQLLGMDLASVSGTTTFLEMGFDSLMLTQASQGIEKKFGARIPFGQLMGKLSTFDLLASALDGVADLNGGKAHENGNGAANRVARIVEEKRQ